MRERLAPGGSEGPARWSAGAGKRTEVAGYLPGGVYVSPTFVSKGNEIGRNINKGVNRIDLDLLE